MFHLASAVSGECEADFDLGLRSNLDSTRALLDQLAGITGTALADLFSTRKTAEQALAQARERSDELLRERERLAWQITELDKLAPSDGEWAALTAEHQRLAHHLAGNGQGQVGEFLGQCVLCCCQRLGNRMS